VDQLSAELQDRDDVIAAVVEDVCYHRSQGFCASPRARRAIEEFAGLRAKQYYEGQGYDVEVRGKPYDLRCSKVDSVLHVEVKGTTTTGDQVLLTPNEVAFVSDHSSSMALFIVSGLQVSLNDEPTVTGGTEIEIRQWRIRHERLTPIGCTYSVPRNARAENNVNSE